MTESETTEGPAAPRRDPGRPFGALNCLWAVLRDIGRVLRYTRLSILVTLLAGLALILTGQGQDLIVIRAEEPLSLLPFYPAVIFWAVNAWYWARVTLRHCARIPWKEDPGETPCLGGRLRRVRWLVRHVPRAIGAGAFALIAVAQFVASGRDGLGGAEQELLRTLTAITLALGVVFYLAATYRRPVSRAVGRGVAALRKGAAPDWLMLGDAPAYAPVPGVLVLPRRLKQSFAASGMALLLVFSLATLAPTRLGWLSSDTMFLVGASLWIAPGTWVILLGKRGDLPLLSFLVVLALIFSFFNDNHALRDLGRRDADERTSVAQALAAWHARSGEARPKLVLVATAGGGSRAAYWTGSLLGTLQDLKTDFDRRLFAISGVSGGSLGAAVFRSLLTAKPGGAAPCEDTGAPGGAYRDCARAILGADFLTATTAALLFPDLVQRFLPLGLLPDRAEALEEAWETAWKEQLGNDLLGQDFFVSWPPGGGARALPALLLNGTSVASGKRIVTSNLRVAEHLTDAYDFFARCRMGLRMSTAANNSARFPIIGPAGTLRPDGEEEPGCDFERPFDRIVDGGYFENFGATTALDLLRALADAPCHRDAKPCDYELIVIQISSDPGYAGVKTNAKPGPDAVDLRRAKAPGSFASELLAPVETLLNTRNARGVLAAQSLHDRVVEVAKGDFIEFRLVTPEGESDPPLGWVLSGAARKTIDCQLAIPANKESLKTLSRLLGFEAEARAFLDRLQAGPCKTAP